MKKQLQSITFEILKQWEITCRRKGNYTLLQAGKGNFPYSTVARNARLDGKPIMAYSLRSDRKFAHAWGFRDKTLVHMSGWPTEVLSEEILKDEGLDALIQISSVERE